MQKKVVKVGSACVQVGGAVAVCGGLAIGAPIICVA